MSEQDPLVAEFMALLDRPGATAVANWRIRNDEGAFRESASLKRWDATIDDGVDMLMAAIDHLEPPHSKA